MSLHLLEIILLFKTAKGGQRWNNDYVIVSVYTLTFHRKRTNSAVVQITRESCVAQASSPQRTPVPHPFSAHTTENGECRDTLPHRFSFPSVHEIRSKNISLKRRRETLPTAPSAWTTRKMKQFLLQRIVKGRGQEPGLASPSLALAATVVAPILTLCPLSLF